MVATEPLKIRIGISTLLNKPFSLLGDYLLMVLLVLTGTPAAGHAAATLDGLRIADYQVNQYTTTPFHSIRTYDNAGNAVNSTNIATTDQAPHSYDWKNRLIGVPAAATVPPLSSPPHVSIKYDALGRVVNSSRGDVAYKTSHFGFRSLEQETWSIMANTLQGRSTYVHGDSAADDLVALKRDSMDYYLHQDRLGSVGAYTNVAQSVAGRVQFSAFGAATSSGYVPQVFYTGRPEISGVNGYPDGTLYDFRTRQYDARLGRFLQRDSIGIWGDPLSMGNGYTYAANNPLRYTDPFGLWSVWAPWTWDLPTPDGHSPWSFDNPQASWKEFVAGAKCADAQMGQKLNDLHWQALMMAGDVLALPGDLSAQLAMMMGFTQDDIDALNVAMMAGTPGLPDEWLALYLRNGMARAAANSGVRSPGQLGREGEALASQISGIAKNTQSFPVNGRTVIPDQVLAHNIATRRPVLIGEVKNVQYQSLTRQLKDYRDLVGPGGRVDVYLPPGARVTAPLQRAFNNPRDPLNRVPLVAPQ